MTGVSPQLLLAAFARAIFSSVLEFLRKGIGRWLLAVFSQSPKYESRYFTRDECEIAFGATGRGRSISPKKRKGTYQQDAKAACGLEGASLVDTIKNKFNNREEFECPHNPSPSERNDSMDTIGDQDQCTCTLSSGSDRPYPENKALPSLPAYCRSAICPYRLREEYWRRLRLEGLEKERQKSGPQE